MAGVADLQASGICLILPLQHWNYKLELRNQANTLLTDSSPTLERKGQTCTLGEETPSEGTDTQSPHLLSSGFFPGRDHGGHRAVQVWTLEMWPQAAVFSGTARGGAGYGQGYYPWKEIINCP